MSKPELKVKMTSYEAGGVLANSKTYDGHRRNASADSGHFDMSTIIDGSENGDSESAMTDLSQENESTDPSPVRKKLSKSRRARNGSAHSNSVDSGVSGSISQDSMELDYERGSTADSYVSRCSVVTELEKVDEGEMDEDEPLQTATVGEDCPDYPESVYSQAIRGVYSLLVEVFSNQESADKLASDLYSKFLIENTIQSEVRMQGITDEEKAQRILNAVMSKLRTSPTDEPFEHFMSVLKCYHSCCDIVVQMRATYQQLQKSSALGTCYSYAYHHAREELVCVNSTWDAAPLEHQMQGGLHSSIKEHQPVSLSGAFESLEDHHQERKSAIFSMLRQRSMSSGGESDVSMSEEEMQDRLKKWEKESKTLMRGIRKHMNKKQKDASTMEEIAHRLESTVEDLQTQVEEYAEKLKRCTEEKQVLEGELTIARRRILLLTKEVITMKKHPRACAGACEHKSKCEKLKKQIKRLEEEKVDYTAKIENLNQQIDMLLSDDHYVFNN